MPRDTRSPDGAVVEFENVSKTFASPQGPVHAVNGLTMTMGAGQTIAFLGPNGAGKSTSLNMLLGLSRPDSGRVALFGGTAAQAIKHGRVGAMLQSGGLMSEVTVREQVQLWAKLHPRPIPVSEALKRANIADLADRRVDKLSGGQQQRVQFAMAIIGDSPLIVLDEPTTGMDVENRQAFWATMRERALEGKTVLFATHYLDEADQFAERVIVINKGRLLADGTAAEIKASAGAKRLSFRLPGVQDAVLHRLPNLVHVERQADIVRLQTSDSDATLYALLDAGYRPADIEIQALGLEQAFLAITAEDNGHAGGVAGGTETQSLEAAR
ncbi:ABC transporter ATP-binding protein [Catenulispora subtropica]|uniref:ABC transporter ATP-binding protein n=1 Tax=Catenulispora subtropica TaxID=450798 RepID=A0ABP5D275_9ACTN